jgi:hypothetical protein
MYEDQLKRLTRIIDAIRLTPGWIPAHATYSTPEAEVKYYDTEDKDEYFSITFDDVEVNPRASGLAITWLKREKIDKFDLNEWLDKLEKVAFPEVVIGKIRWRVFPMEIIGMKKESETKKERMVEV